jgi:hypothetical protein
MQILENDTVAFDMSNMGLGKTFTSTECVVRLGIPNLFVICPVSMESKWKDIAKQHRIPHVIITSFSSLRSVSGCQPKHGLLKRISITSPDSPDKKVEIFEPTDKFTKMVEGEGIVIVVDEVHNLKNSSEQYRACKTLTDVINKSQLGKSRCIFLSGTPIDKEEQVMKILRLMGLYTSEHTTSIGLTSFVQKMYKRDAQTVAKIVSNTPANTAPEMVHLCHLLFKDVVCKHWVSSMPNVSETIDAKNGYYKMGERELRFLEYYIDTLHNNTKFMTLTADPDGEGSINIESGKLGSIVKSLEGIEQSKMPLFERLVRETLLKFPNCKVCVGLNYVQRTLYNLVEKLKDLNPAFITGETPKAQRDTFIKRFQEPNLNSRLIITNIRCLSTGVDMDDKHGDFPRFIFASPNYNIVELHQFSRRFARVDTKSAPIFRFVYGSTDKKENSILNALARKTNVMQEILREQSAVNIKFPGEYETYTEQ